MYCQFFFFLFLRSECIPANRTRIVSLICLRRCLYLSVPIIGFPRSTTECRGELKVSYTNFRSHEMTCSSSAISNVYRRYSVTIIRRQMASEGNTRFGASSRDSKRSNPAERPFTTCMSYAAYGHTMRALHSACM